jgi:hypothetical protein
VARSVAGFLALHPHPYSLQNARAMHVIAIHTIHDPSGFKKAEAEAVKKGLPPEFKLPIQGATNDHSKGICVWEGPSVKAVQELVDSVVGPYSKNEYFEMTMRGM